MRFTLSFPRRPRHESKKFSMFSSQLKRLLHLHRWRLMARVSACQSVSQRVGVAYLAWAIAHSALKPPIKSFATIEVMPASLIRLDKSLILTQLQLQHRERKRKERGVWERVAGERRQREETQIKYKIQVQQQAEAIQFAIDPRLWFWNMRERQSESERWRGEEGVVPPQAEGSCCCCCCCCCLRFACGDGGCYWIFKIYRFYVELPLPLPLPLLLSLPLPLALLPVRTLNPAATSTAAAGVPHNMRVLVVHASSILYMTRCYSQCKTHAIKNDNAAP